jgi:hypothetical protein
MESPPAQPFVCKITMIAKAFLLLAEEGLRCPASSTSATLSLMASAEDSPNVLIDTSSALDWELVLSSLGIFKSQ